MFCKETLPRAAKNVKESHKLFATKHTSSSGERNNSLALVSGVGEARRGLWFAKGLMLFSIDGTGRNGSQNYACLQHR